MVTADEMRRMVLASLDESIRTNARYIELLIQHDGGLHEVTRGALMLAAKEIGRDALVIRQVLEHFAFTELG